MKRSRIALAIGVAITGMAVSTSVASAATVLTPTPVAPLAGCTEPAMSQPFTLVKDFNFYTLAPGGTFDSAATGCHCAADGGNSAISAAVAVTKPPLTIASALRSPAVNRSP